MHPGEYYSAPKRKAILTNASTRMNPEDIWLREISQSQKRSCWMIPLVSVTKNSRIRKDRGRMMGARGQREGAMGSCGQWGRSWSLPGWKAFWRWVMLLAAQHCERTLPAGWNTRSWRTWQILCPVRLTAMRNIFLNDRCRVWQW